MATHHGAQTQRGSIMLYMYVQCAVIILQLLLVASLTIQPPDLRVECRTIVQPGQQIDAHRSDFGILPARHTAHLECAARASMDVAPLATQACLELAIKPLLCT